MSKIKVLLNEIKDKPQLGDINYGFNCLNNKLNVLNSNSVITIFGTIAKEKTSFALNLVLNAAKNGTSVLYLSNKEKATTLAKKILAIESGVSCEKIHRYTCNEEEMDKINNSRAVLEDLNLVIEEIDSFKDEKQRMDELFKELSKDSKLKLVVYDQYDNLNVLPFLRRCMNTYNFTLIIVDSVNGNPYATFGELYSKVNNTLESFSDCVIGIHKEDFIDNYKNKGVIFANIYKLRNGKLSVIKYNFDNSNFRINEIEIIEYEELVKCYENMLLL